MEMNVITNEHARVYGITNEFYGFLARLESHMLSSQQKNYNRLRIRRVEASQNGIKPQYKNRDDLPKFEWRAPLPEWLVDQRNQMTGPANDAKLCVKMINSHSPGVMLDLEDSCANTPDVILDGHVNAKACIHKKSSLCYWKNEKDAVCIDPDSPSKVFLRVRGLHMGQMLPSKTKNARYVSASLFDLAWFFWDLELDLLRHPPLVYIPKTESAAEALWWKNAFATIEQIKRWPTGTIKCMALVESHQLAYGLEQFVWNLQPYLVGLNLGRWDYMASLLEYNYRDPAWLMPDRNTIPIDVKFFQNLRYRMAQVCHTYGLLAIGGMTALYPSRKDEKFNERALKVLKSDKENEAACFMDGAWTGHPDQNEIAVRAFPEPNQLDKLPGEEWLEPDLREFPERSKLKVTEEGTREAIRTCIQYRQAVLNGEGAKLINGYMEDLATDRIYRIMICQRIDFGVHTEEEVLRWLNEEQIALGADEFNDGAAATWNLILNRQFNPR